MKIVEGEIKDACWLALDSPKLKWIYGIGMIRTYYFLGHIFCKYVWIGVFLLLLLKK